MKINYDCMRDILMFLEENLIYTEDLEPNILYLEHLSNSPVLKAYSIQDIAYSSIMLKQADFINARIADANGCIDQIIYYAITYSGHQFLANIQNDNVWNKTKGVLGKIGTFSVEIISKVASTVLLELINKQVIGI